MQFNKYTHTHTHTRAPQKTCPMTAQVKCPGDQDGKGCRFCQKSGVSCNYSVRQKPGPKGRKRKIQDLGPATEVTKAPSDSSMPQRQTGVAGRAGGGDASGGSAGGESGSPLTVSSPSSTHLRRPPKKPKNVPAPLTQWVWGSEENDSRPASVHWGASPSPKILDAGRSGSDLDIRREQVLRHLRQESQLQLQQLQQLQQHRPLPLVGTGSSVNPASPPFPPVFEPGSGAGEGFRGDSVSWSHPGHPPHTAALGGADSEDVFDAFAYDLYQGQLDLGDWSCADKVLDEYFYFLGGSAGGPSVSDAGIDSGPGYRV